jgi:hypothetical protein
MNKNSLANIILEKSLQRSNSQKLRGVGIGMIENKSNNITESMSSPYHSNKLIKITQFNSGLAFKERRTTVLAAHNSHSTSPYKQFTVKKVKDITGKFAVASDSVVENELRRREL